MDSILRKLIFVYNFNIINKFVNFRSSNYTSITLQHTTRELLAFPTFSKGLRYQNVRQFRQTRNFKRRSTDPS